MTREEALAVLKTNYRCMTEEKNCPRTCEGCGLAMQPGELEEAIRVAIKTLEPKTGHWIQTNEFFINQDGQFIYKFICSECKSLSYFRKSNKKAIGANVCPDCGCRMIEPQESEE